MRHWFINLCIMVALTQAVYNGVRVLVSYRVLYLGGDVAVLGIITALFSLAPLIVAMAIGRAVDRQHAAAVLVSGMLLTVISVLIIAFSHNLIILGAGFVLLGFGQTLATIAAQGFASILSNPGQLDRTFAGLTLAISLGQSIGIPVAGIILSSAANAGEHVETTPALYAMALLALVAVPFGAVLRQNRDVSARVVHDPRESSVVTMLSAPGMKAAVLSSLVVLVSVDLLTAYLPVLGQQYGFSVLMVTMLLTVRTVSSMLSRFFLPMLLRGIPRKAMLVSGTLCSAVPMILLPLVPNPWVIGVLLVVAGFFWGIGQPLTMTWVIALVSPHTRTAAISLRLMGNRLGQVLVPLGAGAVAGASGAGAVFIVAGTLLGISAFSTWQSVKRAGDEDGGPAIASAEG